MNHLYSCWYRNANKPLIKRATTVALFLDLNRVLETVSRSICFWKAKKLWDKWEIRNAHHHNTKNSQCVYPHSTNKSFTMNSALYNGIRLFNSRPLDVRNSSSIKIYRRKARFFKIKILLSFKQRLSIYSFKYGGTQKYKTKCRQNSNKRIDTYLKQELKSWLLTLSSYSTRIYHNTKSVSKRLNYIQIVIQKRKLETQFSINKWHRFIMK